MNGKKKSQIFWEELSYERWIVRPFLSVLQTPSRFLVRPFVSLSWTLGRFLVRPFHSSWILIHETSSHKFILLYGKLRGLLSLKIDGGDHGCQREERQCMIQVSWCMSHKGGAPSQSPRDFIVQFPLTLFSLLWAIHMDDMHIKWIPITIMHMPLVGSVLSGVKSYKRLSLKMTSVY